MNILVNGQKAPLAAFLEANRGNLSRDDIARLRALRPGQSLYLMGVKVTRAKCGACEGKKR